MTPELRALIEAVREWRQPSFPSAKDMRLMCAITTYELSLTTPPAELPAPDAGKKWVRVEYNSHRRPLANDLLTTDTGGWFLCENIRDEGYGSGRGFGWRQVDDPDCDSLEKIADEIEAVVDSGDHADYARRIRALIAKEASK